MVNHMAKLVTMAMINQLRPQVNPQRVLSRLSLNDGTSIMRGCFQAQRRLGAQAQKRPNLSQPIIPIAGQDSWGAH